MRIRYHNTLKENMYPLTILESPLDLLVGLYSLREKINVVCPFDVYWVGKESEEFDLEMFGLWSLPKKGWEVFLDMEDNSSLWSNEVCLAKRGSGEERMEVKDALVYERPWHLFQYAGKAINYDLQWKAFKSRPVPETNIEAGQHGVWCKNDYKAIACVFNTTNGPIVIDEGVEIMEGSTLRGPIYLGKNAQVKMGAKIYGPSVFGEECRVGGEVSNSVFQPFSNKGHDGFLGNSAIGRWCNLGADTNSSNLKNNYSKVAVHSYTTQTMEKTDLQFCGLLMGDHSKTGINTMLNTATSVGCFSNLFGADFPEKHIRSFAWGSNQTDFELDKAFDMADAMMERRDERLSEWEREKIRKAFNNRHQL